MRNFDKFHINAHTVLGFWFSLLLAGCTLPTPEKKSDSSTAAMFYVDKSTPQILEERMSKEISIPVEHNINIAVCLKDVKSRKDIPNESFIVNDTDNKLNKNLRTDSKGCLVWTEVFPFSFFGTGKPVQIDRLIQGQGSLQGVQKVSFQYNPWEKTIIALKEQSPNNSIGNETTLHLLAETPEQKSMILDNMRLTIEEKAPSANSANLNMEIRTSAQVPVTKSNKAKIYETLSFGEFKTTIYLIHVYFENGKEVRQLLSAPIQTDSKIANQVLLISTDFQLPILRSRSQFYVGLKVEPKSSITGLKPFEGVFNVGEFDQIKGNFLARIKNISLENPNFKMEEFINLKEVLNPATSIQNGSYINAAFQVDELEFSHFEQKNQNTMDRTKIFNTKACVHSNIDRKTAKGQIFQVVALNGSKIEAKANQLGCFEFVDSINYNFLDHECKKELQLTISNSDLGINEKISIQIDPWAEHTPVKDVRFLKQKELLTRCATGTSELLIENFNYKKNEFNLMLDSNLSLTVSRNVNINVRLRLNRPSLSNDEGYTTPDLPKGPYLFKYAIVDGAFDFSTKKGIVYFVNEKVFTVAGTNFLAGDIPLQSPDLKAIGNTNQIIIEILPLDSEAYKNKEIKTIQNMQLKKQIFVGSLEMENQKDSLVLKPFSDFKDENYFTALKQTLENINNDKNRTLALLKDKQFFASEQNLNLINLISRSSNGNTTNKDLEFMLHYLNLDQPDASLASRIFSENKKSREQLTFEKFMNLFQQDKLDELPKSGMCQVFYQLMKPSLQNLSSNESKQKALDELNNFYSSCLLRNTSRNSSFIDIHYRILAKSLKSYTQLSSRLGDFSNSFSFNQSHTYSINLGKSMSVDVGGGLSPLSLITDSKLFNASVGFRYAYSRVKTDSEGFGSTVNVQSGTSGYIEQIPFKLTVNEYEKCAVIRIHPEYYKTFNRWDEMDSSSDENIDSLKRTPINSTNKNSVLTRGFMICDGQTRKQDITMIENYFIINQKRQQETQGIDMGKDSNRMFFAALRGRNDFALFLNYVGGKTNLLQGTNNQNFSHQQSHLNTSGWKDFSTPSYPGHYIYKPATPEE